jgi:Transcriptional regulatory protein, C terminal
VTFYFEEFSLDVDRLLLTARHRTIALTQKAFDLLVLQLEAQPRVVPKAELHERLWPGTFVSESSLATLINGLRGIFGDDPRNPRLIRTVQRGGVKASRVSPSRMFRFESNVYLPAVRLTFVNSDYLTFSRTSATETARISEPPIWSAEPATCGL